MRDKLRAVVDAPGSAPDAAALPRVGPRLYARYQRGSATTGAVFNNPARDPDLDWYQQLNTTPSHRIISGVGTRVVQKDQEPLMQAAWAQVGEIRKANEALVRIQFARYVGESMHKQHLSRLPLGPLSQVMRGVQAKVRAGSGALTVYGTVKQSATAPAAMTAAYRRVTRARGPISRVTNAANTAALGQLVATATGFKDFRRAYVEPDGIKTLSPAAIEGLSPDSIARTLGIAPAVAKQTLTTRLAAVASTPTMTDRMFSPTSGWKIPAGNIDLGALAATRISERAGAALPDRLTTDVVRVDTVAPLLAGLANSSVPGASKAASDRIGVISTRLQPAAGPIVTQPPVLTHPPVGLPGGIATPVVGPIGIRQIDASALVPTPASVHLPSGCIDNVYANRRTRRRRDRNKAHRRRADCCGSDCLWTYRNGADCDRADCDQADRDRTNCDRADCRGAGRHGAGRHGPVVTGPVVTGPVVTQPSPVVRFETSNSRVITQIVNTSRQVAYADVANAASLLALDTGILALPTTPVRPALTLTRAGLLNTIVPGATVTKYAKSRLTQVPDWLAPDWFDDLRITPIMKAPRFDRPMYEALDAYDRDWLIPGSARFRIPTS